MQLYIIRLIHWRFSIYCSYIYYVISPWTKWRPFRQRPFWCIFLNENVWIFIKMSLKLVPMGLIGNKWALVQVTAWCRPGDKPLSEPMMVSLLTHICVDGWKSPWCVESSTKTWAFLKNCDRFQNAKRPRHPRSLSACIVLRWQLESLLKVQTSRVYSIAKKICVGLCALF